MRKHADSAADLGIERTVYDVLRPDLATRSRRAIVSGGAVRPKSLLELLAGGWSVGARSRVGQAILMHRLTHPEGTDFEEMVPLSLSYPRASQVVNTTGGGLLGLGMGRFLKGLLKSKSRRLPILGALGGLTGGHLWGASGLQSAINDQVRLFNMVGPSVSPKSLADHDLFVSPGSPQFEGYESLLKYLQQPVK